MVVMPELPKRPPRWPDWVTYVAIVVISVGILMVMLAQGVVAAQEGPRLPPLCGERIKIIERLGQKYDEAQAIIALGNDGAVIEVYVSPEGTWSMLRTYPRGPTCMVGAGTNWQALQIIKGDPA